MIVSFCFMSFITNKSEPFELIAKKIQSTAECGHTSCHSPLLTLSSSVLPKHRSGPVKE